MVVSTCRHCKKLHLIADNENKLDLQQFGGNVANFLKSRGEKVVTCNLQPSDLEENYLVEKDGVLELYPKNSKEVIIKSNHFTSICT